LLVTGGGSVGNKLSGSSPSAPLVATIRLLADRQVCSTGSSTRRTLVGKDDVEGRDVGQGPRVLREIRIAAF
jgi:hypothetical protein